MATYNYLDKIGLGQVWNKIKSLFTNTSLIGTTTAESINTDELTSGNLIVNGSARFTNGLYGELTGNVIGNISGKAGTADAFSSNKNVTLTGDVTGTASSTGGWSVVTTVGDDSHNHTTQTIVPIAEKTYTGLIGTSSNNAANDSFYFMSVKPDNFYSQWKLTYKITATIPNHNEYRATSFVTLYGVGQASAPIYSIYNQIYSTSYRPYYYHNFQRLTETGFNANYGNAIGIGLRSSNSRSTSGYERTIKIELLETEQCTAILLDNVVKWANWTGTGSTNYAGLSEFDGYNIGLRETGEDNDTTTLQYSTARLTTGSNGIPAYNIVMMKPDGTWEGLTVGNATTATTSIKNTSGFVLGQLYLHWSGTNFGANTTVNANGGVRTTQDWTDFRYTLNCGTTLTSYEMVYLKGTMSGGLFYLADTWWTQTLPTTNDGFIYIPVGMCYGSGYACSFWGYHGAYYHNGTTIVEYIAGMPQPDWNENDTTSPNYITNRTHWKEDGTATLIPEQTVNVEYWDGEDVYYTSGNVNEEYVSQLKEGTEIYVNCQGNNYNTEINYSDGYYSSCDNIDCTDYMIGLTFNHDSFSINFYYSGEQYNVPSTITISTTAVLPTFHKLDDRYLNGKLIQSGIEKNSEIFNDYTTNIASGIYSHSEGHNTTASGHHSHSEGSNTTASGDCSHSEGESTLASGSRSHSEGYYTTAQRRSQHVFGEYNVLDTTGSTTTKGSYIEIVGNGTSTSKRSNARTLDWNGNEILKGKLTIGTAPTNNMDVATKQYVDNATSSITTNLSGLTDTTISSPTNGQFLQYNSTSSKWENKTYTAPVTSVNGQTGAVSITVPSASSTTPSADGTGAVGTSTTYARADHVHPKITQALSISSNILTLTGSDGTTSSVTIPTSGGTGGASSLNELNDTTITSPSDGQILRYDNSSSKWINSNETTYTFDGTYNASTNKAATVSTVTDAIGALTIPTKTSDLTNDSGFMTGMTILSYGSSTWANFIDVYTSKRVVYCRASSNSNPASGSQTRLAFMAYVNNAESPTEVEFQYYRSVSSHSNTQQGDQVYVYKLTKTGGWSVTVRESYTKVVAGTGLTGNWASGAITLGLDSSITATTSANGLMSSTDKSRLDTLYADYSSALTALGVN